MFANFTAALFLRLNQKYGGGQADVISVRRRFVLHPPTCYTLILSREAGDMTDSFLACPG